MGEKKTFLLRIDPELHAALERWAADDLRSVNGQIEFVLKDALRHTGRIKQPSHLPPKKPDGGPARRS